MGDISYILAHAHGNNGSSSSQTPPTTFSIGMFTGVYEFIRIRIVPCKPFHRCYVCDLQSDNRTNDALDSQKLAYPDPNACENAMPHNINVCVRYVR